MENIENPNRCAFGTWKLPAEGAKQVISDALRSGFRQLDTAAGYANEEAVAEGIAMSGIPRVSLYISGKLWNTRREYEKAIKACKKSLKVLGLEYFDQYLIHWPASPALYDNWREVNDETWRAMETLKKDGLVRNIGVCNFKKSHLEALLQNAELIPYVDQIEFHPGYMQSEIRSFCEDSGIKIEAWSPLGNGRLLDNPTLLEIAEANGRSLAQVCLRWCIQHKALPISKTVSPSRMQANLDALNFELSKDDMAKIDAMPEQAFSGMDPDRMTQFG